MSDDCSALRKENARLRIELAAAREAMQSFVYVVSHDLGAPLRALVGFSDILQQKYGAQFDEKGKTYLTFLHDGGAKAQAMMQGLLLYSRIYSQGQAAQNVDLGDVLKNVLAPLSDAIEKQILRPTIGPLPTCLCDRAQIETLFSILIQNAMTYKAPHRPVMLGIIATENDTHWEVSVGDNGIGIPREEETRIFQIFKRLHTDDAYPGLGVGLALAARIVERHKGTITARPQETGGTVFSFTLHKEGPETPPRQAERT